jgi:hypothetical protein
LKHDCRRSLCDTPHYEDDPPSEDAADDEDAEVIEQSKGVWLMDYRLVMRVIGVSVMTFVLVQPFGLLKAIIFGLGMALTLLP